MMDLLKDEIGFYIKSLKLDTGSFNFCKYSSQNVK